MEKKAAHYKLSDVQLIVADSQSRPFTVTALQGGLALGLTESERREVVLSLDLSNFFKSMTILADQKLWQDVSHGFTPAGVAVYIKITFF
jgi:motility quorum-sensing regulator/GCU-specific mRNA interferase toxin